MSKAHKAFTNMTAAAALIKNMCIVFFISTLQEVGYISVANTVFRTNRLGRMSLLLSR